MGALDPRAPEAGTPGWFVRERRLPEHRWAVRGVLDDAHPDGAVLDDPIDTEGMYVMWRTFSDEAGRLVVFPSAMELDGTPKLWFVDTSNEVTTPGLVTLVAFGSDHLPAGTVVANSTFTTMPVASKEQAGAIRWSRSDGAVDQLFVQESWRRKGIGTLLLFAAGAFHQAHGWAGSIHSDGRHTQMGDAFAMAQDFPHRIPEDVKIVVPMDLPEG